MDTLFASSYEVVDSCNCEHDSISSVSKQVVTKGRQLLQYLSFNSIFLIVQISHFGSMFLGATKENRCSMLLILFFFYISGAEGLGE